MINRFYGFFKCNSEQKNKYLCTDDSSSEILENYNQVFNEIRHHIKEIDNSDIIKYDKNC